MSSTPTVPALKNMVELVLEDNPVFAGVEARNSDIALTILIWRRWYGVENGIALGRLFHLPREDNVKRVRAVLQNVEHKYLPTDPSILIKRGIEEAYWFDALGYNLTKEEWQRHHKTVAETKPPIFFDEAAEMTDEQIDTVGKMMERGETKIKPVVLHTNPAGKIDPFPTPVRLTKMKAIYLPKTYTSSGLQQNQEYEIEVEQLATGKPIKMVKPIEAVYPNLPSFGRTWKVVG